MPGRESVDIARYKNCCQDDKQHNYPECKQRNWQTLSVCWANSEDNYQALINNYREMTAINHAGSPVLLLMIITCAGEAVSGVRRPLPLQEPDDDEHHEDKHEEGHGEADVQGQVRGRDLVAAGLVIAVEDGEVMTRGH